MEEDKVLSTSERRMAENQLYFRKKNEDVVDSIKSHHRTAKEEGIKDIAIEEKNLQFICECSDNDCRKRILMDTKKWSSIHSKDDVFVVYPGHIVDSLEEVKTKTKNYEVVRKYVIPKVPKKLHRVSVPFN